MVDQLRAAHVQFERYVKETYADMAMQHALEIEIMNIRTPIGSDDEF